MGLVKFSGNKPFCPVDSVAPISHPSSMTSSVPPVCVIVVFGKTMSVGGRRHDTESEDTAEHDEDDGEGVEVSPTG